LGSYVGSPTTPSNEGRWMNYLVTKIGIGYLVTISGKALVPSVLGAAHIRIGLQARFEEARLDGPRNWAQFVILSFYYLKRSSKYLKSISNPGLLSDQKKFFVFVSKVVFCFPPTHRD
jgi:hypothetical protein